MPPVVKAFKHLGHAVIIGSLMLPMRIPILCSLVLRISFAVNRRFPNSRAAAVIGYHVGEAAVRIDLAAPRRVRVATLTHGAKLAVRTDDWLWRTQLVTGCWEPETTAFIRSWLREGDVFLDVGANNGYFACVAAQIVGESGVVHAFEPAPKPFRLLKASVRLNGFDQRVICHSVAVGEKHGATLTLHLPADPRNNGQSSLVSHEWLTGGRQAEVEVWSLDGFLQAFPLQSVRLVKFDIEGGELSALRGGERFFCQVRPDAVVCEVWSEDFSPHTSSTVLAELQRLGYVPWRISADGTLVPFDGRLRLGTTENLCFLPEEGAQAAAPPRARALRGLSARSM